MPSQELKADTSSQSPGRRSKRLGELLLERGLITPDQIESALKVQKSTMPKKLLGEILVEMGLVESGQVVQVMANSVGVPFVVLMPQMIQAEAIDRLPKDFPLCAVQCVCLMAGRLSHSCKVQT